MAEPGVNRSVLLVVEDDQDDQLLLVDALRAAGQAPTLKFVQDGQELLDYLRREGEHADPTRSPWPSLILLDLRMPRLDGPAALEAIKADPRLRRLPVVVMTTSWSERDIARCYDAGASSFVLKPVTFQKLVEVMGRLCRYWFGTVELPPSP